jgi:hypothetical protein
MSTPSIDETINWVWQHHYAEDDDRSCAHCGGQWPCVPFRLTEALEDARKQLNALAEVVKNHPSGSARR